MNASSPHVPHLPSAAQLLRSTLIVVATAAALTVTAVLPAEFGVDPTGVGRMLGLTQMGEIKIALAREAQAHPPEDAPFAARTAPTQSPPPVAASEPAWNETVVTLADGQAAEVKLDMKKGAVAAYEWSTNGPRVNFDLHADAPGIDYFRYGRGSDVQSAQGDLKAEFDGAHGWFWRNRSGGPVTVTLRVRGDYAAVRRVL